MLDEPLSNVTYVSVFIPHFIGSPSGNCKILRKFYIDCDLSSYKIAEITGWSKTAISESLRKSKIKKFNIKSPTPSFGERDLGGIRIKNKSEQKIIQKILVLRSKKYSFQKIANELNKIGITTKHNCNWTKDSIQKISKRETENLK
jgi:hypothetical protein